MAAEIPENPLDEADLHRALGPWHLISLGIGFLASSGLSYLMSRRLGLLASTLAPVDE